MTPVAWLPSGSTELPAARFVLFANDSHEVHRIDESATQLNGVSFTGHWESGSLAGPAVIEATLRKLTIVYLSPVNTTITVKASGDGGETWSHSSSVTITASTGEQLRRVVVGMNVTGFDLRVRLELDTAQVILINELHPVIARRGEYVG